MDHNNYVEIDEIIKFRKIAELTSDRQLVIDACDGTQLRMSSGSDCPMT